MHFMGFCRVMSGVTLDVLQLSVGLYKGGPLL